MRQRAQREQETECSTRKAHSRHQCRLHDALHGLRAENAERNPIRA